jgi:hypothetical protein
MLNKMETALYRSVFPFTCLILPLLKVKEYLLLYFLCQLCNFLANNVIEFPNIRKCICLYLENCVTRFEISSSKTVKGIKYHPGSEQVKKEGKSIPVTGLGGP